ncbi:MAG: hypothetical protein HKN28_04335 [Alphaproteobacteria bacterium]|nr:hypothetical protein [Alphaproteobacteria bacterium]
MKKLMTAAAILILLAVLPVARPASAAPVDPFVGHWVGMGITENGAPAESVGLIDRELEVTIKATTDGFDVTWVTRRPSRSNKIKHSSISVPFASVEKPGIYRMTATGEPLSGSPYIWARIAGRVMEVHSITISEHGVLEYQKFVRTLLTDDEMQLRFTRSLDGSIVRSVLAHLRRQ